MILVNGISANTIHAMDRGLHYGDGLFETLTVIDGRPQFWRRHLQRLQQGCLRLGLPLPDMDLLQTEAHTISHGAAKAVLKIIITRGIASRGYRAPRQTECAPTRMLTLSPYPQYPACFWHEGVTVRLCETRLSLQPLLAGIKHLNRLEQVIARSEWSDPAIAEGLMLDMADHVIEGTVSNVFAVKHGQLLTPDLTQCGVAGITRGRVMELAGQLGIPTSIEKLNLFDLRGADELFLTNSLIGVWPVKQLAQQSFVPGPVTQRIAIAIKNIRE